jgi:hypothetical protein
LFLFIYLFCPIFLTTRKVVVSLLGTLSWLAFLLFYFLHYLSPPPSARISTPILWLQDFRLHYRVCSLFFVSAFFYLLYLRDQGGVAPGHVVFALLSIFLFFALSFSSTFGKDLYADLVAPGLRTSLLGMSAFLCFCFFISGVAPWYVVFA